MQELSSPLQKPENKMYDLPSSTLGVKVSVTITPSEEIALQTGNVLTLISVSGAQDLARVLRRAANKVGHDRFERARKSKRH